MTYLLLFITFLTASLKEEKLFKKQFKWRPKLILFLLILATALSFVQEYNNSIITSSKEELSTINNDWNNNVKIYYENLRLQSNTGRILNGIGETLAKYKLAYDSASKKIEQLIKDSGNRKTTFIQGDIPVVGFAANDGIKIEYLRNDTLRCLIHVVSDGGASTVSHLNIYVLISNNTLGGIFKDLYFVKKITLISKNESFTKQGGDKWGAFLTGSYSKLKTIIILLQDSFTDGYGNNRKNINQVGILDVSSNKFSFMASPYDDDIIQFLKNRNILEK